MNVLYIYNVVMTKLIYVKQQIFVISVLFFNSIKFYIYYWPIQAVHPFFK